MPRRNYRDGRRRPVAQPDWTWLEDELRRRATPPEPGATRANGTRRTHHREDTHR